GRIANHQIEAGGRIILRPAGGIGPDDFDFIIDPEASGVVSRGLGRRLVNINRHRRGSPPADGFQAEGAAAGKGVQQAQPADVAQYIKDSAPDFVAHRVGAVAGRRPELPTAQLSGNDSHDFFRAAASLKAAYQTSVTDLTIVG